MKCALFVYRGIKRPRGLGSVLDKINKKQKISTLVCTAILHDDAFSDLFWGEGGAILEFLDRFDNIEHLCIFSIKIRIPLHHHLFSNFKNVVIFEGIAKIHQNWQPIKKNLL